MTLAKQAGRERELHPFDRTRIEFAVQAKSREADRAAASGREPDVAADDARGQRRLIERSAAGQAGRLRHRQQGRRIGPEIGAVEPVAGPEREDLLAATNQKPPAVLVEERPDEGGG